jgi:hypothetical protein
MSLDLELLLATHDALGGVDGASSCAIVLHGSRFRLGARRSDVVGIYPNDESLVRLAGALLIEQNDEWLVGRRYLSAESLAGLYAVGQVRQPERPAAAVREVALLTT